MKDSLGTEEEENGRNAKVKKVLVFKTTNEIISNYDQLDNKLFALGWQRYNNELQPKRVYNRERKQYFNMRPGFEFISLPLDFEKLRIIHLYEIVVQTRTAFAIKEVPQQRNRNVEYALSIRECGNSRDLQGAKRLHAKIASSERHGGDIYLTNLLIQMYGRCGGIHEATKLFQSLQYPNTFSWNIVINCLTKNGYLETARAMLDNMPAPTIVSGNTLVGAYAQYGYIQQAEELFHRMPQKNIVTWNSLLSGYVQNGETSKACNMFEGMPEWDVFSWSTIITAYAQSGYVHAAKRMLERMGEWNIVTWNAMITCFAQNGLVLEALKVFDSMPERELSTWNAMLTAYAQNGHLREAMKLYERMPRRDVFSWNLMIFVYIQAGDIRGARGVFDSQPERNTSSWNTMISAYAQSGDLHEAKSLLENLTHPNVLSFAPLVAAYAQRGEITEARLIFGRMDHEDVISWNTMVAAYIQVGRLKEAEELFEQMPQWNTASWNTMLVGYAQSGEMHRLKSFFHSMPLHSVVSWTTMVAAYGDNGDCSEARKVFERMPERTVVSWNSMITSYADNVLCEEAIEVFHVMSLEGIEHTEATLVSSLAACALSQDLREGQSIHSIICETGRYEDNITVSSAIINMYGKCNRLESAERVFDKLRRKDLICWNTMIAMYGQAGDTSKALQVYGGLHLEGFLPNTVTFTCVLGSCNHGGYVEAGCQIFISAPQYGVSLTVEHYRCMVDLLGRIGYLEEAEELIKSMPHSPGNPAWTSLLSSCRIHNDTERLARVAEANVSKLRGAQSVLIANAYMDVWNIRHPCVSI